MKSCYSVNIAGEGGIYVVELGQIPKEIRGTISSKIICVNCGESLTNAFRTIIKSRHSTKCFEIIFILIRNRFKGIKLTQIHNNSQKISGNILTLGYFAIRSFTVLHDDSISATASGNQQKEEYILLRVYRPEYVYYTMQISQLTKTAAKTLKKKQ